MSQLLQQMHKVLLHGSIARIAMINKAWNKIQIPRSDNVSLMVMKHFCLAADGVVDAQKRADHIIKIPVLV